MLYNLINYNLFLFNQYLEDKSILPLLYKNIKINNIHIIWKGGLFRAYMQLFHEHKFSNYIIY